MDISRDDKNFYSIPDIVQADSGELYEIQDKLGCGGNAAVYEALDYEGNTYAIKFLLNLRTVDIGRFKQEIRVLRSIKHQHLICCIDEGTVKGTNKYGEYDIPFMIMEKAELNLKTYLEKKGRITFAEYFSQFCGLSEALGLLNNKVVHRDIKLENILVIGERWVLSDLGLCSYIDAAEHEDFTRIGQKIGPKYWMSPESINNMYDYRIEIVPASDVFQLSAVFWFVVNGKYPLGIVTENDWVNDDMQTCKVLLKGLAFDNNQRPQNGCELFDEFKGVRSYYERRKEN